MKTERIYSMWAKVAIAASCVFATVMVDAGLGSVGVAAPKVISVIRKFMSGTKMPIRKIINGADAVKDGKKLYRAIDLVDDSIGLGKGLLGKLADGVSDDVVEECATLVRSRGVGVNVIRDKIQAITKSVKLSQGERDLLENDAYLRILQRAGRISAEEADDAFRLLKGTEDFPKFLSHCCSKNKTVTGSIYEFRQALAFRKRGFDVALDLHYAVGAKSGRPDLDLLVKKGKSLFLIETKHFTSPMMWNETIGNPGMVPEVLKKSDRLLNLKAYLNSEFGESLNIKPIFTFLNEPPPDLARQLIKRETPYFVGEAEKLAEILSALH